MADAIRFDPGWLMRSCHDAHIRTMCDHGPLFFKNNKYFQCEIPISQSDAAELYAMMSARFAAWTGKPLREFIPSDPPSSTVSECNAS